MKVYICGSHSCGKSTLARYISTQYNLPMISEVARIILSEQELQIDTLRSDINIADKYQSDVFERQLLEEKKYKDFVSDRSLLDVLAYSASHSRMLPEMLKRPELSTYVDSLKLPEAFLFFVRPSKATMKADGVREHLNWDGVISIDAQIKFLLEMFDLRYFAINTDNAQERIREIDSVLNIK